LYCVWKLQKDMPHRLLEYSILYVTNLKSYMISPVRALV
jgi:hypothetical protein